MFSTLALFEMMRLICFLKQISLFYFPKYALKPDNANLKHEAPKSPNKL